MYTKGLGLIYKLKIMVSPVRFRPSALFYSFEYAARLPVTGSLPEVFGQV